jgi:S-formylglutathione hydrolase FrmB
MDRLITNNNVREMIIVVPDADTKYLGAMYTNTPVLGNYEDYITRDLVEHLDNQYRTLPQSASRGIAGHSLGGYGAIYLAMKYPEVYAAVYGHEPSALVLELWVDSYITPSVLNIIQSKDMNQFRGADYSVQRGFFMAASFSPNPDNPPFFVDWPWELVDGQIKRIEPIWNKWLEYELLTMVTSLRQKLLELKAIRFDAGTGAQGPSARIFDQTLTAAGIPHIYEEFAGGHSDRTAERVETKVLPFFSDVLAFEMLPVKPAVQPKGKLATTWGEMKRRR